MRQTSVNHQDQRHNLAGFGSSRTLAFCLALTLSACGPAASPSAITDPHEAQNREFHAFNLALDKNLVRPVAMAYTQITPDPIEKGVSNFAANLDIPGFVVNDILQLRLGKAVENTLRFALNTTIGIGGLFDPAMALGVNGKETDFGETLHLWGMPEGNYVELPLFGPSNDRDELGMIVDYALNPLRLIIPADKAYLDTLTGLASKIGERGRYSDTLDSILYESADGYAQARLLYTDHRRFNLGQEAAADTFEDPYAQ